MLDYAVMMYLDAVSEARILSTIQALAERGGVNPEYRDMGMRPHLTLAEFNTCHFGEVRNVLRQLAGALPSFPIRFGSIGIFPLEPAVLFHAPIVDDVLFSFHRSLNMALKPLCSEFSALYQERSWVAHCTLALNLTTHELLNGISFLSSGFEAVDAHFAGLDVYSCCPFRCLETYPLSAEH